MVLLQCLALLGEAGWLIFHWGIIILLFYGQFYTHRRLNEPNAREPHRSKLKYELHILAGITLLRRTTAAAASATGQVLFGSSTSISPHLFTCVLLPNIGLFMNQSGFNIDYIHLKDSTASRQSFRAIS